MPYLDPAHDIEDLHHLAQLYLAAHPEARAANEALLTLPAPRRTPALASERRHGALCLPEPPGRSVPHPRGGRRGA
jgi:hypothetical protein